MEAAPESAEPAQEAPEHLRPPSLDAEIWRQGKLSFLMEPVGVYWDGTRLNVSVAEARILACLAERGTASWAELDAAVGGGERSQATLRVLTHRLRAKLQEAGAGAIVTTVRGWGVAFRYPRDGQP